MSFKTGAIRRICGVLVYDLPSDSGDGLSDHYLILGSIIFFVLKLDLKNLWRSAQLQGA